LEQRFCLKLEKLNLHSEFSNEHFLSVSTFFSVTSITKLRLAEFRRE
jgi:hypothetical protein